MEPPSAKEDEKNRGRVGEEAEGPSRCLEAEPQFSKTAHEDHEEEVRRTVHGALADIPDDAVARGQVARVAQEHGGVFLGPAHHAEMCGNVPAEDEEKEDAETEIERRKLPRSRHGRREVGRRPFAMGCGVRRAGHDCPV